MSNRKLLILGVVALLMVVWAIVQSRVSSGPGARSDSLTYLIQGLDPDSVDSIVLGTGEDEVTLKREGRGFVVVNKSNYQADPKQINELFSNCIGIQTTELYTDNAANHETLEVTEEKAGTLVKFLKADASLVVGVAIGKSREGGEGTYVRLLPGDKVYVTLKSPWIKKRATDYMNQEIASVERDNIVSVTVSSKDGEYTLNKKEGETEVTIANVPAGKKLKTSDAGSVFNVMAGLRFDDVTTEVEGLTFDRGFVCRLKDSTVYTLAIGKKDDKTYVTCKADFTDQTPVEKKSIDQGGEVESPEELKKKEAKLLAKEDAMKLTARHRGWIYEVPDWKAKNLTKPLPELLEDDKKPEPEATDPNVAAPTAVEVPQAAESDAAQAPIPQPVETPTAPETAAVEPNSASATEPNAAG